MTRDKHSRKIMTFGLALSLIFSSCMVTGCSDFETVKNQISQKLSNITNSSEENSASAEDADGQSSEDGSTESVPVDFSVFEDTVKNVSTKVKNEDGTESDLELSFWYNDASNQTYYEEAAKSFSETYGVNVTCSYIEGDDYLDIINDAQIEKNGPDVFIISNDLTKKAYLAGLCTENTLYDEEFWDSQYPEVAKAAFTTNDKQVGYPVYFDTCMMIYDSNLTEAPATFTDITNFAVSFEDETNTKQVFRFDISDPFCDYLFMGRNADVFGINGDDTSLLDLDNEQTVQNMTYYQTLRDYFSLDVSTSTYSQLKSELANGNLVYGIVKTDVLSEMDSYGSAYCLCPVPNLSDELFIQDLSVTYGAEVSEYTEAPEYANLFAAYLSYQYAENEFSLCKRVASRSTLEREDVDEMNVFNQYNVSVSMPKVLENGDFWIYTEICFKNIWNGNDVQSEMTNLQTTMEERVK